MKKKTLTLPLLTKLPLQNHARYFKIPPLTIRLEKNYQQSLDLNLKKVLLSLDLEETLIFGHVSNCLHSPTHQSLPLER
jgi:hypothetical protein